MSKYKNNNIESTVKKHRLLHQKRCFSFLLISFLQANKNRHTYNIKLKQVVFYMDTKQAENINDCIKNILEGTTCQLELKPIPISNVDFPQRKKKRKKRYRSIGLFWDGYEILI